MRAAFRSPLRLLALTGLALSVAACAPRSDTLTVSAAASLTDAFTDIVTAYEAANQGINVELNLAASGVLAQQIRQGAPVDVFASASEAFMDGLEADGLLADGTRRDMAGNQLVLITPLDGPSVSGPADLPDLSEIAIGNPELVPAGMYAQQSLQSLGIWEALESRVVFGESVRQVLAWTEAGEVSAGLVFTTDAQSSQRVRVVSEIPPDTHERIAYPIAVLRDSHAPGLAGDFVSFVTGPEGQAILASHGFSAPTEAAP